jgi:CHASE1-domain containing sensor protein
MYLVPENARNRLSIGYDMASDPVRRAAMDRAELMERPIVSGKLQLVRAGHVSQQVGFVMYMPVFGSSRDDGSRTLRGFVFTPFAAEDFLRASMPADPDAPLGLRLYDGAKTPGSCWRRNGRRCAPAVSCAAGWMLPGGAGCWWWKRRRR